MACDMSEPYKFPSLDSCQKVSSGIHKAINLALRPVVGLLLQVRDVEKFPHALGFESLDPFFRVSKQGPCFKAIEEDQSNERLVQLELACQADGVAPPDPV